MPRLTFRPISLLIAATLAATACSSSSATPEDAPPLVEKEVHVQLTLDGPTLRVSVADGAIPVMTDVWLYTEHDGVLAPLAEFADPSSKRKYRGLMLPCMVAGQPSGFSPCDDDRAQNGFMTDAVIDTLVAGSTSDKVTAVDGVVEITLDATPTDTIVVVVGREDERYAGAAAIDPSGQSMAPPAGTGAPESHRRVTYTNDVAPILAAQCTSCHAKGLVAEDYPLTTFDEVVHNNFAYAEEVEKCGSATPEDADATTSCIAAITKTEYMVDPGNPALSTMLRRTLPDANGSVSTVGLLWYGTKSGARFDENGDRRMPSTNTMLKDDAPGSLQVSTYFDSHPAAYKVLWDWVAQGAVE